MRYLSSVNQDIGSVFRALDLMMITVHGASSGQHCLPFDFSRYAPRNKYFRTIADDSRLFTNPPSKLHHCHFPYTVPEISNEISNTNTPDPFMIKFNDTYIWTFTSGDCVKIQRSSLLNDFHDNVAAKRAIWYRISYWIGRLSNVE